MASCETPLIIWDKINLCSVPVPCGKCKECLARRCSGWSFRLMQEEKQSSSAYFITLTYGNDGNIPRSKNNFMEINKRHLQLFFKRLRKAEYLLARQRSRKQIPYSGSRLPVQYIEEQKPIKYYAVGEYGGKFQRPHYHVIIFNATVELIEDAWGHGYVHYGTVTTASVGYTMKYISKPTWRPKHRNDDRQPPFSLMSKGIGECYLTDKVVRWHHKDLNNRFYCPLTDGGRCSMPRYYKNRMYTKYEKKVAGHHARANMIDRENAAKLSGKEKNIEGKLYSHINQFNQKVYEQKNKERSELRGFSASLRTKQWTIHDNTGSVYVFTSPIRSTFARPPCNWQRRWRMV